MVRNLSDDVDGFLKGIHHLIHNRDPLFTAEFLAILDADGVQSVKLRARSPNLLSALGDPRAITAYSPIAANKTERIAEKPTIAAAILCCRYDSTCTVRSVLTL